MAPALPAAPTLSLGPSPLVPQGQPILEGGPQGLWLWLGLSQSCSHSQPLGRATWPNRTEQKKGSVLLKVYVQSHTLGHGHASPLLHKPHLGDDVASGDPVSLGEASPGRWGGGEVGTKAEPGAEPEPEPEVSLLISSRLHSRDTHKTHWRAQALWAGCLPGSGPRALSLLELGGLWCRGRHCCILHDACPNKMALASVLEVKRKISRPSGLGMWAVRVCVCVGVHTCVCRCAHVCRCV